MRKLIAPITCAAMLLIHINSIAQSANDRFDSEISQIIDLLSSGKISRTEAAKESLIAAKSYFPNDKITHAYYESLLSYVDRLDKGELTSEQAQELYKLRTERYNAAINARRKEQEELMMQSEREERLRRDEVIRQLEEERQRAATATFIQGIGKAFRDALRR